MKNIIIVLYLFVCSCSARFGHHHDLPVTLSDSILAHIDREVLSSHRPSDSLFREFTNKRLVDELLMYVADNKIPREGVICVSEHHKGDTLIYHIVSSYGLHFLLDQANQVYLLSDSLIVGLADKSQRACKVRKETVMQISRYYMPNAYIEFRRIEEINKIEADTTIKYPYLPTLSHDNETILKFVNRKIVSKSIKQFQ